MWPCHPCIWARRGWPSETSTATALSTWSCTDDGRKTQAQRQRAILPGGKSHEVGAFSPAFKALVVDLDQDGNADIVDLELRAHRRRGLVPGRLTGRRDGGSAMSFQPAVAGAHTLQAAEWTETAMSMSCVGQMRTTKERALSIHLNVDGRGMRWARQVTDTVGLHNGVVADVEQ